MQMKTPSQPEDVARVIYEAVTTDTPRLRYLEGEDAKRLAAGRQRMTDEEYVATGRDMPDAGVPRTAAPALRLRVVRWGAHGQPTKMAELIVAASLVSAVSWPARRCHR